MNFRWTFPGFGTGTRRRWDHPGAARLVWLGLTLWLGPVAGSARDGDFSNPRICVMTPLGVAAGTTATLKLRGIKLAGATAVVVSNPTQSLPAEIREKKKAEVPNGFDAKEVGDSLVTVEISLPANLAGPTWKLRVLTPEGATQEKVLRVLDGAGWEAEKEPNNGFREAQALPTGKGIAGALSRDKDVDVFTFLGHAHQNFVAEIFAGRAGSLLDGVLTLYDANGQVLASNDDSGVGRDPQLRFKVPADGTYFLAVQDANDHGTPWHAYELTAREEP